VPLLSACARCTGGAVADLESFLVTVSSWSGGADTCEALRRHRGVGRALLHELLRRGAGLDVYLTTISRQAGFYMRQGFLEVPLSLAAVPRQATRRDCQCLFLLKKITVHLGGTVNSCDLCWGLACAEPVHGPFVCLQS